MQLLADRAHVRDLDCAHLRAGLLTLGVGNRFSHSLYQFPTQLAHRHDSPASRSLYTSLTHGLKHAPHWNLGPLQRPRA
jgi:hypothetical protein